MAQEQAPRAEVLVWELGEYGVVRSGGHLWQAYVVGSRDAAYAELERLEERRHAKPGPDARH